MRREAVTAARKFGLGAMSDADSSRLLDADDGTDHDHDSGDEPLGEVDTRAWGAAALGAGISLPAGHRALRRHPGLTDRRGSFQRTARIRTRSPKRAALEEADDAAL